MENKESYRYFISYSYNTSGGAGFGSCWFDLPWRITNHKHTTALAHAIATENDMATVAITGFQLVEQP